MNANSTRFRYSRLLRLLPALVISAQAAAEIEFSQNDITPRFLAFYEMAREVDDPEKRFELWQEHYGFVALPPGVPDRDERARAMLDEAWPQYPEVIDRIRTGIEALDPPPESVANRVVELFDAEGRLPPLTLLYFVGMMENNAFFAPIPEGLFVALPAEMAPERREITMAHEFTHAVHHVLGDFGFDNTVAALVFKEGLAMHASRRLVPGRPDAAYLTTDEAWLARCSDRLETIIVAMQPEFHLRGDAARNKYTVGEGNTGMEREAYCAGWHLVGRLIEKGHDFAGLARVAEDDIPAMLEQAAARALKAGT